MKYKAEIFDQLQALYHTTGFNDHQLHCVIEFENKLNEKALKAAVNDLILTEPILSGAYRSLNGRFYWDIAKGQPIDSVVTTVRNKKGFESFIFSRTDEETGPQIKVCLFSSERDSLAIILNHMVTDGAGMKQCAYRLAGLYSKLLNNPGYHIVSAVNGDRSFHKMISSIPIRDRIRILFLNNKDNNRIGSCSFPMSTGKRISPFILTHKLPEDSYIKIIDYCKRNKVTVNDFMVCAYFRVLSGLLGMNGKTLDIPIMIDMRRYLKDKQDLSLTNLSSTVNISTKIDEGEEFKVTLHKLSSYMEKKKADYLGLNPFLKLQVLYKIFGDRIAFWLLKKSLRNPPICMTNIGIIDDRSLIFSNSPVRDAYVCGSIKYRPHFQMAVSSFKNTMTLSVNLYGDSEDQIRIRKFFDAMDSELERALT